MKWSEDASAMMGSRSGLSDYDSPFLASNTVALARGYSGGHGLLERHWDPTGDRKTHSTHNQ